jgi:hypothetical protein
MTKSKSAKRSTSNSNKFLFFNEKCLYNKNGKKAYGPSSMCMFFIIGKIISFILVTLLLCVKYKELIANGVSKNRIISSIAFSLIWGIVSIYIQYSLCKICRGVYSLIFSGILFSLYQFTLFKIFPKISNIAYDSVLPKSECDCNN